MSSLFLNILVGFFTYTFSISLFSQNNIMATNWEKLSDIEKNIQLDFILASKGVEISLKEESVPFDYYYVTACKKEEKLQPLDRTIVGLKINNNQLWSFCYTPVIGSEGYSDFAYAGYIKTEFGEQKEKYLIKANKVRLYPENNIYTECITFKNGMRFIIEDKIYLRRIDLVDGRTLRVENYSYEDCSEH